MSEPLICPECLGRRTLEITLKMSKDVSTKPCELCNGQGVVNEKGKKYKEWICSGLDSSQE